MLTKVTVKNFKSLRSVTLDLGQRNVLVGANMSGKSNILDIFRFVYDMTFARQPGSSALPTAIFLRGGFDELYWKGGEDRAILMGSQERTILIALSGKDGVDGTQWLWDYEVAIQGVTAGGFFRVSSEQLHVRKGEPTSPRVPLSRIDGASRYFLDVSGRDLGPTSDPSRSMLEFEIPGWLGNLLRTTIASWRFYELVPSMMRNPNPMSAALFLTEHGENLSQWLLNFQSRYGDSFTRIQSVVKDCLPQVTRLFTSPTQQSTVLLGSYEQHLARPVMLFQMSAGELAFVAFLSLIFGPPELTGSLYCIEDLENYLHPRLIEALLEVLRQSQEEWERKRQASQIIMTTHSPLVVDKTKLEEIIFVERRQGATVCSRPADRANLRKLLEDGEVGLGDLVYSGALSDVGE